MADAFTGLTREEAQARLAAEGRNEPPAADRRTPLKIVLDVLREPMLALLLGGGLLYLLLGDLKEALILLAFALISIVITIVQETRTERVLEALRNLSSPRALVIRDGQRQRIPGLEVARGDLLVLEEGERAPADALLAQSHDLMVDESLLTGEAVPVRKRVAPEGSVVAPPWPGGEDQPHVYSGSLITRGSALAVVTQTGPRSVIGQIGRSLGELEREPPRLQAQTRRMVLIFSVVGISFSVMTVLLYGYSRGDWLQAALAGIAIGMSMLPSELPVVLAVFMAMGAWRISKARVLTRRAAAIETLGSATVLCADKTGTLTENRMTIVELRLANGEILRLAPGGEAVAEAFQGLAHTGLLASARHPVDPMERAFHQLFPADGAGQGASALIHRFGLRPDLLAVTHVWALDGDEALTVAAKGAPEAIAELCGLDAQAHERMRSDADAMAREGLRVLGVARAAWAGGDLPGSPRGFAFDYLGLAGLADPLRAAVPQAVAQCQRAGIRVVMITGDYPATAAAIAHEAGIEAWAVMTGEELEGMDDAALRARLPQTHVFARIMPQQKLRIVQALKAEGEVVAMTGDGVNDAPSLKAAHIGVAMGGRGTDVAREAASLVLIDDDFSAIVEAIRLGRCIYDNLRKAMCFIFAVHLPIAGLALLPLLFGLPVLLGPVHIAFLQMVIDPVSSLVFEAEPDERDVMRRPPRDPQAPLFSHGLLAWAAAQGLSALGVVVAVFFIAINRDMPTPEMRALCFFALVVAILCLVLVNRSFSPSLRAAFAHPSLAMLMVLALVAIVLAGSLVWPLARDLFRFGPLHGDDLLIVAGAGLLMLLGLEAVKLLRPLATAPGEGQRTPWVRTQGSPPPAA